MPIKILVVEDEKDARDFLAILLEMEGYVVSTATDGLEALKKIEIEPPDMIISDISMPNLDGVDLVKTLRSSPEFRDIPVLMLSAYGSGNLISAINAGANHAMRKPVNVESLLKNVREWTGEV